MYVVENKNTRPQFNLALEEHLCLRLRAMNDGSQFFMLWQNEPSIIVGRFQNTYEEIDSGFVREHGIHLVRRNSGGGAVYHDLGNLNYSFIMPDSGDLDFAFFTGPIIRAITSLGAVAEPSGRNDILIGGKKISGGAQFRRNGVTLHHGTLLYDTDLDVLSSALRPAEDKFHSKAVKSVRSRVGNIKPHLPEPMPMLEFQERITRAVEESTPLAMQPLQPWAPDAFALEEAERLAREKYSAWEWNYGSSPQFTERKKMRFPWGSVEALLLINEGKIARCSFYGDYFGSGDYAQLMSRLTGAAYTRESVAAAIADLDPSGIFAGSAPEDIIDLLAPE